MGHAIAKIRAAIQITLLEQSARNSILWVAIVMVVRLEKSWVCEIQIPLRFLHFPSRAVEDWLHVNVDSFLLGLAVSIIF